MPAIPSQKPAGRREQDAVATLQRHTPAPCKHTQSLAQNQDLDLTRGVMGWTGSLGRYSTKLPRRTCRDFANLSGI